MAAIRRNVLTVMDRFLDACVALDEADSGVTAAQARQVLATVVPTLQIQGDGNLSYWDLFVLWHSAAMALPLGGGGRNAAHSGPIFLPWHRHFMILLEQWMQIVLDDPDFGLPYWDWAADGDLPQSEQIRSPLWGANGIGNTNGSVTAGPCGRMRVRLWQSPTTGIISMIDRRLRRSVAEESIPEFQTLPNRASVRVAMNQSSYDAFPWEASTPGHRSILEGWEPATPDRFVDLHNLVHVWVGGDMSPATSPNDPVFFLNHCNVDRIWEAWMVQNGRSYSPVNGQGPQGHSLNSQMFTLLGDARTPADVLDPAEWYSYDSLVVS
ncbi:MAG: tyrosinase family protein [Cyanobacteria bacterium P01_A01_bin.114]